MIENYLLTWARRLGACMLISVLLQVPAALGQGTGCTGTNPGGAPAGAGLYAEYYTNYHSEDPTFFTRNTPGLTRVDAQLNFASVTSFGNLTPTSTGTATDPDFFSLRERGSLSIGTAGLYTFYLTADDGAYLWIDNAAVAPSISNAEATINNGTPHDANTVEATVYLTAGQHNMLVHYGELVGNNILVLEYAGPGVTRQVVPSSVLCTAVQARRNLPAALQYAPARLTAVVGNSLSSPVPTITSTTPVTQYILTNASRLPAGITINAATGQLTANATVPLGFYRADVAAINAEGATTFRQIFSFTVAPAPSASCTSTRADGGAPTGGLYAEYYRNFFGDNPAFFVANTPGLVRIDNQVNFNSNASWGDITPTSGGTAVQPENFSLRLRGSIYLAAAGTYTFHLTSDDGARLWFDNAALQLPTVNAQATIDNGGQHNATTVSASLPLTAGLHDIQIQYGQGGLDSRLVLEYESAGAGIARQVVPSAILCSSGSGRPLGMASAASKQLRLSASPNPTSGASSFVVHVEQLQAQAGQLQLLDLKGRICYTTELPAALRQEHTVRIPQLAPGMYVLRLTTPSGFITQKLVVN